MLSNLIVASMDTYLRKERENTTIDTYILDIQTLNYQPKNCLKRENTYSREEDALYTWVVYNLHCERSQNFLNNLSQAHLRDH